MISYVFSFFYGLQFHVSPILNMVSHACLLLLLWFSVIPKPSSVWICVSVVDYEWVVHNCGLSSSKSLSHLLLFLYMYFPGLHPLSLFLKDWKQASISLNHVIVPVAKYFNLHRLFVTAIHLKLWLYHQKKREKKKEETKLALDSQSIREIAITAKWSKAKLQASLRISCRVSLTVARISPEALQALYKFMVCYWGWQYWITMLHSYKTWHS